MARLVGRAPTPVVALDGFRFDVFPPIFLAVELTLPSDGEGWTTGLLRDCGMAVCSAVNDVGKLGEGGRCETLKPLGNALGAAEFREPDSVPTTDRRRLASDEPFLVVADASVLSRLNGLSDFRRSALTALTRGAGEGSGKVIPLVGFLTVSGKAA